MLHVLASLRGSTGLELVAHGVDHGLRSEAARELSLVRELAASLDVPFDISRVDVAPGGNLQARARAARYEALRAAARATSAPWIATAHTADDRAETVLLRLLRGSGARGLGVLPPKDGDLVRPLVRASHADVLRHVERHALRHALDPSNLDRRYARVRVRLEVLPLLEELSPKIVAHLNHVADELLGVRAATDPLARLGRRQRESVEDAFLRGKTEARVRVDDRKEVWVRLSPEGPVVTEEVSRRAPRRNRRHVT